MKPRNTASLFATWLIAATGASAQSVPASPTNDTVLLSPFEVKVDQDKGYTAADTINAGRLSTNLLMTPSDTTVLTREFLNDLGALTMVEASSWLTNAIEQAQGMQNSTSGNIDPRDSGNNTTLRGQATQPSTRNYFPSSTTPAEYIVERVEAAAGPNAILYGVGGAGGQVNYITKSAQSYNFARVRGRVDSYGSTYGSIDLNRHLSDKLDVRYNGFWRRGETWQDRVRDNGRGNALGAVYRPWKNTKLSLDADIGNTYRSWLIDHYSDGSSNWNGVPVSGKITAAQAAAAGLSIINNSDHYWIWINGLGLMDWNGFAFSTGTGSNLMPWGASDKRVFAALPTYPKIPHRSFYIAPDQVHVTADTKDIQGSFSKTFDFGLTAEVAFAYATIYQNGAKNTFSPSLTGISTDVNLTLPTGQPNPNVGKHYDMMEYNYNVDGSYRISQAERVGLAYPIRMGRLGTQSMSLIVQHQEGRSRNRYNRAMNPTATPLLSANNVIRVFRYFDDPSTSLPNLVKDLNLVLVQDTDTTSHDKNDSVTLGTAGSYFQDRFSLVGGFRRDKYASVSGAIATRDAATAVVTGYSHANLNTWHNSASAGAVYFPFKVVGVYAHYDEGFSAVSNPNPDIHGSYSPTAVNPARNFSAGLRFRLLNGAIVGSIGHYKTNQTSIFNMSMVAMNNALKANGAPMLPDGNTVTPSISIADSSITQGIGWEASATMALAKSFRLMVNAALPDVKIVAQGETFRKWYLEQRPTFLTWANDPTLPITDARRVTALTAINYGDGQNTTTKGRTQNKNYQYRLNIFGNYTLSSSWLRGIRLGAGAQLFGKRVIGTPPGNPSGYFYDKVHHIETASLGYSFTRQYKEKKYLMDLQLNVVNLFDYDEPLFSGATTITSRTVSYYYPNYYTITTPRTVRLTSTISF